jgi:OOP family OmpA-OmpF porin
MKILTVIKHWPLVLAGFGLPCIEVLAKEGSAEPVPAKAFAERYVAFPPVGADQAQVVYFRSQAGIQQSGSAHVYINREFHTGLLPGGYTRFCLVPGTYTLGAYLNDAPRYMGKHTDLYQATLQGGRTYFLRVREDGDTFPMAVSREEAERELPQVRMQVHALSRASTTEDCRFYDYLPDERHKNYTLSSDVLFAFGKSSRDDISAAGQRAVRNWLKELQRDNAQVSHIEVIGHTDPIGNEPENQLLGLKRADAVRALLIDNGLAESVIAASSAGNREPVVHTCYGSLAEQISCYAPNRRVVLRVETSQRQQ